MLKLLHVSTVPVILDSRANAASISQCPTTRKGLLQRSARAPGEVTHKTVIAAALSKCLVGKL